MKTRVPEIIVGQPADWRDTWQWIALVQKNILDAKRGAHPFEWSKWDFNMVDKRLKRMYEEADVGRQSTLEL